MSDSAGGLAASKRSSEIPSAIVSLQRPVHPAWAILAIAVAVAIVAGWAVLNPQARNLRTARRQAAELGPILRADPHFEHVDLGAYTGGGGALWVRGTLLEPAHATALRGLIEETSTVRIRWTVEVWTGTEAVPMNEFLDGDPATDEVDRALGHPS